MGIDAIVSLISFLAPKAFDLVKGWVHKKDSPEQVLATLANTNPEALAKYIEAEAKLMDAQNASVNADVAGPVWKWVYSVRALVRVLITVFGVAHIAVAHLHSGVETAVPEEAMYVYEMAIGSWFGSRLK